MTKLQYWSPLIIGAIVGEIYGLLTLRQVGLNPVLSTGVLPMVAALCCGLTLQLILIGAQGFFAAVLPVPFGKSLRGTKCRVIGFLVLLGALLEMLLALTRTSLRPVHSLEGTDWLLAILWRSGGLVILVLALVVYLVSIPAAEPDFSTDEQTDLA
jgi:hypothetical protein